MTGFVAGKRGKAALEFMIMDVNKIKTIEEKLGEIVLGKEAEVRLALACILSLYLITI